MKLEENFYILLCIICKKNQQWGEMSLRSQMAMSQKFARVFMNFINFAEFSQICRAQIDFISLNIIVFLILDIFRLYVIC